MRRRELLAMLGGAALVWPNAAPAQQPAAMRRLGFLGPALPTNPMAKASAAALLEGLKAQGWKEGVSLTIDWRWYGEDAALAARQAAELVALAPQVILAAGNIAVEPIRRQTHTIPIVFALTSDPVGMGYVESLAHPGGNITGFSSFDPPIYTKMLQMLTEIAPPPRTVAVLYNPQTAPYAGRMLHALEDGAAALGIALRDAPCHDDAGIAAVMAALAGDERGGLLALGDLFNQVHQKAIIAGALKFRIPIVVNTVDMTASGGLMSYTIDIPDLYRRAASYADRILRGAKVGELPVQRPTKFETAINLKTAKEIGVTVSQTLLATADKVIE